MNLTHEEVLRILKIIDESDYDEVRLEFGDLKLHVQKQGVAPSASLDAPFGRQEITRGHGEASGRVAGAVKTPVMSTAPQAAEPVPEGMVAVRAPMLGTFYRAPSPGERPFVEVGDKVSPNDTVCLVEVMKLFNSVKAGVAGTIVKIVAENAAMVEHEQPLVIIDPS